MNSKKAIIIGAGPAGLTAAYELLQKTDIKPVIFEKSADIGGISKTINYKGNRIDIGGHRFFSKSDKIMDWWQNILPLQGKPSKDDIVLNRNITLSTKETAPDPEKTDIVMLVRKRLSRIYFLRHFFDYPISLTWNTLNYLGLLRIFKIGISYIKVKLFPIKNEKSLEDFFINRFGNELYLTFFKDYTQKVWGIPCNQIRPEWGAQRIKGLSITKTIINALRNVLQKDKTISQKNIETSLIEQFMYPKLGPGQLWEEVAKEIKDKKGEIHLEHTVVGVKYENGKVKNVDIRKNKSDEIINMKSDYLFSSMPVKQLIESITPEVPLDVKNVAEGLCYRDFMTVGILLKKLEIENNTKQKTINNIIPDNWIYIQERDVKLGRLQLFNNWSPYMVKDPDTIWIGLEYFCDQGDELWNKIDSEFSEFAIKELIEIGFIKKESVIDSTVIRIPKAYPAYFGSYDKFHIIKNFVGKIENLFLIGRNGMHRYNNQDHSMLSAMISVENIINKEKSKEKIWQVNAEDDYHE